MLFITSLYFIIWLQFPLSVCLLRCCTAVCVYVCVCRSVYMVFNEEARRKPGSAPAEERPPDGTVYFLR